MKAATREADISIPTNVSQKLMKVIALAIGAVLQVGSGIYPAEWLTGEERENPRDINIGTTNDWWLRTSEPGSEYDLYIQSRYSMTEWITKSGMGMGRPSSWVMAHRLKDLVQEIENEAEIKVALPARLEDRLRTMQ